MFPVSSRGIKIMSSVVIMVNIFIHQSCNFLSPVLLELFKPPGLYSTLIACCLWGDSLGMFHVVRALGFFIPGLEVNQICNGFSFCFLINFL